MMTTGPTQARSDHSASLTKLVQAREMTLPIGDAFGEGYTKNVVQLQTGIVSSGLRAG